MSVPEQIRSEIKEQLWAEADRLNWSALDSNQKSRYYLIWTETPAFGGRLSNYMDARKVRVYIKDTLLKPYTREASSNPAMVRRVLNVPDDMGVQETSIKPHGIFLADGRHIVWSRASEWKATLMSLHERAFTSGVPYAAVFTHSASRYSDPSQRAVVDDAANRLGVEVVRWLD